MISKTKKVLCRLSHEGNSHLNFYVRVKSADWLNTFSGGIV